MDIPPNTNGAIEMNIMEKGPWFPLDMGPAEQRKVRNLVLAAKNGEIDLVKEILKTGEVDINSKYKWETALMVAARSNNLNLCQVLLNHGANCNVSRVFQQTPLWIAASHGNLEVMKLMVDTKTCTQVNMDNALRRCVIMNFLHGCETMLIAGADIDATDPFGYTSLHIAAGARNESCPESNQWKIYNPNSWKIYHSTPFETTELLIMWNANVMAVDSTGCSPLHFACEAGNEDIIKLLIENKADINAIGGEEQRTPLHIAVINEFPHLVQLLLREPNIQANRVDKDKDTPLMVALQLHRKECVRYFLSHDKWATYMSVAKRNENGDVIDTPMRQLIRSMPDFASYVMDKCIELSSHKDPKHPDFLARFNFAFLDDTFTSRLWLVDDEWNDINTTTVQGTEGYENFSSSSTPVGTLETRKNDQLDGLFSIGKHRLEIDGPSHFSGGKFNRRMTIAEPWKRKDTETNNKITPDCDARLFICQQEPMGCKLNMSHAKAYTRKRTVLNKNHPLSIASHEKCNIVLGHPLAIALINYKWRKFGRYHFYGTSLLYLVYVGFLTAYVRMTSYYTIKNGTNSSANSEYNNVFDATDVISIMLVIFSLFGIIKFITIAIIEFPSYIFSFGHLLELMIYTCTFVLVLDAGVFSHKLEKYPLAAICIFAAWFNILLTMRQLPVIGIFFIMFTRILKNSLIVLFIFLPIIVGFAMTFSILLDFMPLFQGGISIATVLVMLSGEVEYVDTLTLGSDVKPQLRNKETVLVTYVFFIVLVVICLLNLLVGLAVSDVDTLHKESEAEMMSLKASNVVFGEYYYSLIPNAIGKQGACGCLRYQPNKVKSFFNFGLSKIHFRKRIMYWFSMFEFNDYRLGAANLIKIIRKEKEQPAFEILRREISSLRTQLYTNVPTPRIASGIERVSSLNRLESKKFAVPEARVLKRLNLQ